MQWKIKGKSLKKSDKSKYRWRKDSGIFPYKLINYLFHLLNDFVNDISSEKNLMAGHFITDKWLSLFLSTTENILHQKGSNRKS